MPTRIEESLDARGRGIYGFPEKGADCMFDSLDEALTWANHDGAGSCWSSVTTSATRPDESERSAAPAAWSPRYSCGDGSRDPAARKLTPRAWICADGLPSRS
jgi:hypothetical protein